MVLGCQHCFQALLLRSSCSQHSYGPADVPVVRKQPADHTSQAAPALSGRMSRATTRSMSRQASSAHSHHADSDYDGAITILPPSATRCPTRNRRLATLLVLPRASARGQTHLAQVPCHPLPSDGTLLSQQHVLTTQACADPRVQLTQSTTVSMMLKTWEWLTHPRCPRLLCLGASEV